MNVGSSLKRTNKTSLLDEELLILDVLFDSMDTFESLVKEHYASWHNLPYSHNLETDILRDLVNKLVESDIISAHTSVNRIFYGLTEAGGKLWEIERVPNWERYCTDYSTDETEHWMLSVESPSIATAQAFIDCAYHCGLYGFRQDEVRTTTLIEKEATTIYWKAFSAVSLISVPTYAPPQTSQVDWHAYERRRSWWRNLAELAKFQVL